jgi:hypothetical protein
MKTFWAGFEKQASIASVVGGAGTAVRRAGVGMMGGGKAKQLVGRAMMGAGKVVARNPVATAVGAAGAAGLAGGYVAGKSQPQPRMY